MIEHDGATGEYDTDTDIRGVTDSVIALEEGVGAEGEIVGWGIRREESARLTSSRRHG